jgi:hypothetical protein
VPAVSEDRAAVTLEITVAPTDLPHARHVLAHQLRQWAAQVDDIQFTYDLHTSRGRFGAAAAERRPGMDALLADLCAEHPHARVREVDYAPETVRAVAQRFFGRDDLPAKNHYGGPVYSYFFGPHSARNDLVLHMDSDMLFGGGSQSWVREATEVLRDRPDIVFCSPFPGPPPPDGRIPPAMLEVHRAAGSDPRREEGLPFPAYSFGGYSTRYALIDRRRLLERLAPLPAVRPPLRSVARAVVEGHPRFEIPETIITTQMHRRGERRLDLLGSGPGMWALHPAMRSAEFYAALPRLIERVEAGDMPAAQLGDFDVNDSLIDWTTARAAMRRQVWWRRLPRSVAARAGR